MVHLSPLIGFNRFETMDCGDWNFQSEPGKKERFFVEDVFSSNYRIQELQYEDKRLKDDISPPSQPPSCWAQCRGVSIKAFALILHSEHLCFCNFPLTQPHVCSHIYPPFSCKVKYTCTDSEGKMGWIYRDWHRKSIWYKSFFLQITHQSCELLPFHFKATIWDFLQQKISHLKWNHNWIWDPALPDIAPFSLDTGASDASSVSKWLSCDSARIWLIRRA